MKKPVSIVLILTMVFSLLLSGCGVKEGQQDNSQKEATTSVTTAEKTSSAENADSEKQSALPISKDKINLKMVRLSWPDSRPSANDTWSWKRFAELSNVQVTFDEYPIASFSEKLKLNLVSGDLPDAYYQMIFTNDQIIEQADAGNLVPLDEMIDKYAPNIKALFERDPSTKKAVTMPDGHIYSLPFVAYDKNGAMLRYYTNKNWLDSLKLSVPTTIDELTAVLKAFKTQDPNKNGKNDEIPICVPTTATGAFFNVFLGAYGLGNRGIQGVGQFIDLGPEDKVRFFPTDERYKELLQQMNAWYKEGLFDEEYFTGGVDEAKWQQYGTENRVGLYGWVTPNYIGEEAMKNFTGITQLKGPHGDQVISWIDASVRGIWSFMITRNNKYPVETMKWVDYQYSEEGYMFNKFGLEGETYEKGTDGKFHFIGAVADSIKEKGLQMGAWANLELWGGGFQPQIDGAELSPENSKIFNDLAIQVPPEETYLIDRNDYKKYLPEEIWPGFIPDKDEVKDLGTAFTDINNYITEMNAKFITGKVNFTDGWDEYVKNLEKMGLNKYMEIKQKQYERYINAK